MKKHQSDAEKFDCPIRGCVRYGERGFARKDKLNDRLRGVHQLGSET